MTVIETLKGIQFVIGPDGQPTAALVDIAAWKQVVDLIEEAEDQAIVRAYLTRRRMAKSSEELGLISWEQAEAEWDSLEESDDAPLG